MVSFLRRGNAAAVSSIRRLSGIRTFVLVGLAVLWFGEGLFTGLQPLAEWWTRFWKMFPPDDASLAAALFVTHASEAPLKAGLFVLAVYALRSGDPSVRLVSMAIATTSSAILWGRFCCIPSTRSARNAMSARKT